MSNVQQHSWLGYHVLFPPGQETGDPDAGSGMVPFTAKQALECGSLDTGEPSSGEDVDLTNYSQEKRGLAAAYFEGESAEPRDDEPLWLQVQLQPDFRG